MSFSNFSPLTNEPVYASSSTVLTSISNFAVPNPSLTNIQHRFFNELDQILRLKQNQCRQNRLKHSQSCRNRTDQLPFDYYRSVSPVLLYNDFHRSPSMSPESVLDRTTNHSNATLIRKAKLGQLRDDTAILY